MKRLIVLFFLFNLVLAVNAQKYMTKNGFIGFYSHTPMEDIKAENNQVVGALDISTGEMVFQALIKSFHFDRALMEEHFNENYMESDKIPKSMFKGKITNLSAVDFTKNGAYDVTVEGDLTIHDVTNKITTKGTIEVVSGGINANSKFNIIPEDYKITIPGVVREKINKNPFPPEKHSDHHQGHGQDQDGIKDPVGITGVRLEVKVHIVTGNISSAQNIIKCCRLAGLSVDDIILGQLASSEATLTEEEEEIGAALVDIGGGTSDIAIFSNGSIKYTSVLPFGGNNITNDIAIGLRTPIDDAEKIKKKYGCAFSNMVGANETIEVPSVGGRKSRTLQRKTLADIIEPRVEEIAELIYDEIKKSGQEKLLASGVIITGGCANLEGMPELAESIFNLPARRGSPR